MQSPVTTANKASSPWNVQQIRSTVSTTPGLLRVALVAIGVSGLLLWWVAAVSIGQARSTVQTIGKDAVPSIIAAQETRANLADMDASAANAFLISGDKAQAAWSAYERDRQTVADRLVTAAQNITYGDAERLPILTMIDGVQIYIGLVQTARSKGVSAGEPDLRAASSLLHRQLLPAADALDSANFKPLDAAYAQSRSSGPLILARLLAAGVLVLAILLVTQLFLARKMHRIINIPLVLATVLLLGMLWYASGAMMAVSSDLKVAKEDAFDSVDALWKARAVAYDANGDESLFMLDPSRGQPYEQSFHEKIARLADVPVTEQVVTAAVSGNTPFKGFLGDELRNITFPGERDAAVETLRAYGRYMEIDGQIRTLEREGRHRDAVDLCIGSQPGQSDWAFAQFDAALGKTLDINQKEFDAAVVRSFADLAWLPATSAITVMLIILLAWVGIQSRLREYR